MMPRDRRSRRRQVVPVRFRGGGSRTIAELEGFMEGSHLTCDMVSNCIALTVFAPRDYLSPRLQFADQHDASNVADQ